MKPIVSKVETICNTVDDSQGAILRVTMSGEVEKVNTLLADGTMKSLFEGKNLRQMWCACDFVPGSGRTLVLASPNEGA